MKKAILYLGALAISISSSAAVAYYLSANSAGVEYITREVERTPALGAHFTSYSSESYPDLTYAAENAVEAVVNIEVVQRIEMQSRGMGSYDPFLEFFGMPRQQQQQQQRQQQPQYREQRSGGSGVIISEDGYVITNNHVVDGATTLKVNLYNGSSYEAEIIGTDPTTDIALIKIDAKKLPTIPFGSSDALRLGEWVLAIGSPFDLQSTITAGIVSAKARQLDVIPGEFRIESFIQTDAAVNPGNSGGALVNSHGELVGINTLIKSQTGSYVGYSFAVPETLVRKVVTDLKEFGVVQRAMLGVSFTPIDQRFIEAQGEQTGIKEIGGVYVAGVQEGSAASEAGIRKGDVILSIDGLELSDKVNLQEQVARHRPNDKVKLSVKRGGEVKHFDVTLRNKAGKAELLAKNSVDVEQSLGAKLVEISQRTAQQLDVDGGVEVASIKDGGLLARARVRKGFVITHINDRRILSLRDVERMIEGVSSIDGVYPDGRSASYYFVE